MLRYSFFVALNGDTLADSPSGSKSGNLRAGNGEGSRGQEDSRAVAIDFPIRRR
jgi:hypothetical protein